MMYSEETMAWQTWKRRFLVFLFLISIIFLTILPMWNKIGVQPTLLLIIFYHWSIYRSDLLPLEQLVLLSLILDGLYAYPLGFSALRLLIDYTILITQRRILGHQRFHWVWVGFAVFVMVDAIVFGVLLSIVRHEWLSIFSLIPSMIFTICLYPLIVWFMNRFIMKRLPAV